MNIIIEKIRAEVNRQARSIDTATGDFAEGRRMEQRIILSVLSDLEKECEKPTNIDFEQELYKHFGQVKDFTLGMQIGKYFYELGRQSKPKVCEGLEEEIERYLHSLGVGYGGWVDGMEDDDLRGIARHFAQWGAEHRGSSKIPNDLEEASLVYGLSVPCEYPPVIDAEGGEHPVFDLTAVEDAFIAGAKWQKEQMMKEAICYVAQPDTPIGNVLVPFIRIGETALSRYGIKVGDKVPIIIVKEDK